MNYKSGVREHILPIIFRAVVRLVHAENGALYGFQILRQRVNELSTRDPKEHTENRLSER